MMIAHGADEAQLLPADGEDEVRPPVGQGLRIAALGLGPLHVPLPEDAAGADGHQAPALLPAGFQRVIGVVEENPEAVHHVAGDQFQGPGRRKGRPAAEKQQGEPPQGKPGGKGMHRKIKKKVRALPYPRR